MDDYTPQNTDRRLVLGDLGFLEEPFSRTADPRFLYLSYGHRKILDGVQNTVQQHRGLAVIEGDIGLGKSSIGRRLESIYRLEPDNYFVVYIHSSGYESEYAALTDVSTALGLEPRRGLTKSYRQLETHLISLSAKNINTVIILDDAQFISVDALSFVHTLYNFDSPRIGKLAQVVLIGQTDTIDESEGGQLPLPLPNPEDRSKSLTNLLNQRREVRSRVDRFFRLDPLTLEETLGMVNFRSSVAGRSTPFLNRPAIIKLWEYSQGVPRTIVAVCSQAVDILGELNKTTVDEQTMNLAIEAVSNPSENSGTD